MVSLWSACKKHTINKTVIHGQSYHLTMLALVYNRNCEAIYMRPHRFLLRTMYDWQSSSHDLP